MDKSTTIASVACALLLSTAVIAGAAPIFADTFESEAPGLNYNSFNWTVPDGMVDVIGNNF